MGRDIFRDLCSSLGFDHGQVISIRVNATQVVVVSLDAQGDMHLSTLGVDGEQSLVSPDAPHGV
jgi:hypothetical protein